MRTNVSGIRRYFIDRLLTFPLTRVSRQKTEKEVAAQYDSVKTACSANELQLKYSQKHLTFLF
jgi:hypothetical protein